MARAAKRTRQALPGEASDTEAVRAPDDIISVVRQIGPTLSPAPPVFVALRHTSQRHPHLSAKPFEDLIDAFVRLLDVEARAPIRILERLHPGYHPELDIAIHRS